MWEQGGYQGSKGEGKVHRLPQEKESAGNIQGKLIKFSCMFQKVGGLMQYNTAVFEMSSETIKFPNYRGSLFCQI